MKMSQDDEISSEAAGELFFLIFCYNTKIFLEAIDNNCRSKALDTLMKDLKVFAEGHSLETRCREGFDQLICCMAHSNHDPLGKQQAAAGNDYCLDDHFLHSHCLERAVVVFQCSCHLC
ncbi:hypothetical protein Prudu_000437 [Prunus dulcis]|uniref:Uncharacterized protein n=1 Tax=Prunus dulcis TaxID=3755 RepID=A0A4Y1QLC3_PRUDU|nr:hypothetical protein Prudu_000437 [Prunus dulcis]